MCLYRNRKAGEILLPPKGLSLGQDFELAVFKEHSLGYAQFLEKFGTSEEPHYEDFASSVWRAISGSTHTMYPDTKIGKDLYDSVAVGLKEVGIDTEQFIFIPTLNTTADVYHQVDGVMYIPHLHPHVVTIDVFSMPEGGLELELLKSKWSQQWEMFREAGLQGDLWQYKYGLSQWRKRNRGRSIPKRAIDYRKYALQGKKKKDRPKNHFIFTPVHVRGEHKDGLVELIVHFFKNAKMET